MSRSLDDLTPDTREAVGRLLERAKSLGLTVRIDSTRRTCAEQAAEYAKGRTEPGSVVTQVSGCGSYHVLGRAVDIYVGSWDCADYEALGKFWESIGGTWGGRFSFRDCVHFEWPHPSLPLALLCPSGISCDTAVANQPAAFSRSMVALLGALFGGSLALVIGVARRRS